MPTPSLFTAVPPRGRERLLARSRQVSFPASTRLFDEGDRAERLWVITSGSLTLRARVPGRLLTTVGTLGPGDLTGWSALIPPHVREFGAYTVGWLNAREFVAADIHDLCDADPPLACAIHRYLATTVAHRLRTTRQRLIEVYGPYGHDSARQAG
ncbi:cyclic nucleotide-binding domain-containing protein [Streptomyces radicis]|uniref:Cyclic nucleotide-binding domain-containing protein n=1 Tax=Streptomyces radicis TaxID=1750517 RepID=A0A3A9WEI8_9ACTN|nr:cyclic nucleotide-binding domain-containing protein [Streptomyces radicis]RKN06066.1 cyclic nucleotide-binding domain-containing protein [Streptomyces radicis]RKN18435.1 cyclic nucleotide-binding domain-containing protein [Streptomyces radicis]